MNCSSPATYSDYDYIIPIIQYLETKHGITFFITTKDFDILYRWWEKRIPLKIIKESLSTVVGRWEAKKKKITSFSTFYYEVKKNFKVFLELNVGADVRDEKGEAYEEIETFLTHYPEQLLDLKEDFETAYRKLKAKESFEINPAQEKLLRLFENDEELNLKVEVFTRNLSPRLRSPGIKKKYRLNYLLNKFNIPDFDLSGE